MDAREETIEHGQDEEILQALSDEPQEINLRDVLQRVAPIALTVLLEMMQNAKRDADRIRAAEIVFSHAGKASGIGPGGELTWEALIEAARSVLRER